MEVPALLPNLHTVLPPQDLMEVVEEDKSNLDVLNPHKELPNSILEEEAEVVEMQDLEEAVEEDVLEEVVVPYLPHMEPLTNYNTIIQT